MDTAKLREEFREFVGEDQYRKFVAVLHSSGRSKRRLLAWQEVLWGKFTSQKDIGKLPFDEIEQIFRVCEIHNCELESETLLIQYGTRNYSASYIVARDKLFPHANTQALGPCWQEERTEKVVFFCSICREAYYNWLS